MVTSIARQSVILKCNMQKAVMLGNYEFYYGAGVAGKIGGFEIPDDIKPLELRELLDKNLDQISPKDEKETYLIHILKEFRPDELYYKTDAGRWQKSWLCTSTDQYRSGQIQTGE